MSRGGKRKGAGAPKGNLNALKHGRYSRQFAEIGALLALDPGVRDRLAAAATRAEERQHIANEIAAANFVLLFKRAKDIARGDHPGGLGGLNLTLPPHVAATIKQGAAEALYRQARADASKARREAKKHASAPELPSNPRT
jgi:hypothetical protein